MKKLTAAWEKKNSKTARAGGASLMALSLAACGGEDNTPFSAADVSAAEAAATTAALTGADGTVYASVDAAVTSNDTAIADAAAAAVDITTDNQAAIDAAVAAVDLTTDNAAATDAAVAAASSFSSLADLVAAYDAAVAPEAAVTTALTTSQDIATTTASNDTITGTQATYTGTDVISDASSTDSDTLTISTTTDISATPTVNGIETITFNATGFTAAGVDAGALDGTDFEVDVANITGGTATFNASQLGTTIDAVVLTNVGNINVVAGTNIATLTASQVDGSTATYDTGTATAAVLDAAGTIADQTINVTVNDDITLTVTDAETLNITGTAEAVVTIAAASTDLDGSAGTIAVTGDSVSILAVDVDDIDATTITGTSEVSLDTSTDADSAIDARDYAGTIDLVDGAVVGETVTIASGATVNFAGADDAITLDINDGTSATDATGVANVTFETASTGASGVTVNGAGDRISTLNIETLTSTAGVAADQANLSIITTASTAITMAGAGDITLNATVGNISGAANVSTLDASAMTGDLTATVDAQLLTITAGSGDDDITALTAVEFALVGGDGDDELNAAADMTSGTFSGFEILDIADDDSFLASQLSGYTAVVSTITGSINVSSADAIDTTTIDMSGLTFQTATDDIDIDLRDLDEASILSTAGFTYTGANAVDNVVGSANVDSISGGAGNDSISAGDGADTVDGGTGDDTITGGDGADTLTGGTGDDNFVFTNGLTMDTITDFDVTGGTGDDDNLHLDVSALETAGEVIALTTIDLVELQDASATAASDVIVVQEVADQDGGAAVAAGAGANVFALLTETYADVDAMVAGLETGDHELTSAAGVDVDDGFHVVWSNGTNAYLTLVSVDNGGTADFAEDELVGTNLADLGANASITAGEFVAADFAFI